MDWENLGNSIPRLLNITLFVLLNETVWVSIPETTKVALVTNPLFEAQFTHSKDSMLNLNQFNVRSLTFAGLIATSIHVKLVDQATLCKLFGLSARDILSIPGFLM